MRKSALVRVLVVVLAIAVALPASAGAYVGRLDAAAKSTGTKSMNVGKKSSVAKIRYSLSKHEKRLVVKKDQLKRKRKAARLARAKKRLAKAAATKQRAEVAKATAAARTMKTDRAMWLWDWESNDQVISFAIQNNVREIFTYAHPGFRSDRALLSRITDLSQKGKARGIQMWAMGGDPSWVTNHAVAVDWIREVVGSGLFNGIHFEIEPHSQEGYWDNLPERNSLYLQLLAKAKAAAGNQIIELSLPWWFHTIKYRGSTLDVAAIKEVDQVTVVTFNSAVDGVLMNAERAVAVARSQAKKYRLASETNPAEVDWITFVGSTNTQMLEVQRKVIERYSNDPYFLGFAVHDYSGWSALRR